MAERLLKIIKILQVIKGIVWLFLGHFGKIAYSLSWHKFNEIYVWLLNM